MLPERSVAPLIDFKLPKNAENQAKQPRQHQSFFMVLRALLRWCMDGEAECSGRLAGSRSRRVMLYALPGARGAGTVGTRSVRRRATEDHITGWGVRSGSSETWQGWLLSFSTKISF